VEGETRLNSKRGEYLSSG